MITPFLGPVTLSKVRFVKGEKDFGLFNETIDPEVLEEEFGGKNKFEYDHAEWKKQHGIFGEDGEEKEKREKVEEKDNDGDNDAEEEDDESSSGDE
jgi:hypothetical protein